MEIPAKNTESRMPSGENDINGIEIHQGDVVSCQSKVWKEYIFKAKIIYNKEIKAFQICYKNSNTSMVTDFFKNYNLAVIGNIWDNPDEVKLTPLELDPPGSNLHLKL